MRLFDYQTATAELHRRRQDHKLMTRVEKFVRHLPNNLNDNPVAVMARSVATPNFEQMCLPELALKLELAPAIWEYTGDKFTSLSSEKMNLARPIFLQGLGRNQGPKTKRHSLVNIQEAEHLPLNKVMTINGQNLVELHRRMFDQVMPEVAYYDDTDWLRAHGDSPKKYYPHFLSLFICHAILLEDFTDNTNSSKLQVFVQTVVEPALNVVRIEFDLDPIIVPILPSAIAHEERWLWYPGNLEDMVVD